MFYSLFFFNVGIWCVCVYDCTMSVHIGLCVHTQHNSHQALWFQGQKRIYINTLIL